eukprot:8568275-Pyramimonas_sp.AAC.1
MVLKSTSLLTPWLIRHCGWLCTRHQKRSDGKTSFERTKGHSHQAFIVEFGGCVSARYNGPIVNEMEPHGATGVWMGKA